MKLFLATLVVCAYMASSIEAGKTKDAEGHYNDIRKRLGHMKDDKLFLDLYKVYATAFVLPEHKDRSNDDYRNYLPSGDECMTWFRKFRLDEYVLRDLDEFVVLDACLGYLYESGHHEEDLKESVTLQENLQSWIDDPKLKEMYENTKIDQLSEGSKRCVAKMLVSSIEAKKQFHDVVCNHHWINLFNTFASCQAEMLPLKDNDSYLKMLYELVNKRGNECFDWEIHTLNEAMRVEYINNPFSVAVNKISYWNEARKQQKERYYPTRLAEILRAVQGTEGQVNIREVANIVRGIGLDDANFKDRLLKNMAHYADITIAPNKFHLHKANKGKDDPTGIQRYDKMIDNMCNLFRPTDSRNFYDFVTPFVRMVTMLKYPEIFGISRTDFIEKVLAHSFETGALYLTVSSCNILGVTEGQFIRQPQNKELHYKVDFKKNTSDLVRWPDVGYY